MEPSVGIDLDFNLTMLARPFELNATDWRRDDIQAGTFRKKPLDSQKRHKVDRRFPGTFRESNAATLEPALGELGGIGNSLQDVDHSSQNSGEWKGRPGRQRLVPDERTDPVKLFTSEPGKRWIR